MELASRNNDECDQPMSSNLDKFYEEYRERCVKKELGIDDHDIYKEVMKGNIAEEYLRNIGKKILSKENFFNAYYYPREISELTNIKEKYEKKILIEQFGSPISNLQVLPDERIVIKDGSGISILTPRVDQKYTREEIKLKNQDNKVVKRVNIFQVLSDEEITIGTDNGIYSLKLRSNQIYSQEKIMGYKGLIRTFQIVSDETVVFGSDDGIISLWKGQPERGYIRKKIGEYEGQINALQVLKNKNIIFGGLNGICLLIPQMNGFYKQKEIGKDEFITNTFQVLPKEKIITSGGSGIYLLTPQQNGIYKRKLVVEDGLINAFQVLPDGRIVTGDKNGRIMIWS